MGPVSRPENRRSGGCSQRHLQAWSADRWGLCPGCARRVGPGSAQFTLTAAVHVPSWLLESVTCTLGWELGSSSPQPGVSTHLHCPCTPSPTQPKLQGTGPPTRPQRSSHGSGGMPRDQAAPTPTYPSPCISGEAERRDRTCSTVPGSRKTRGPEGVGGGGLGMEAQALWAIVLELGG